MQPVPPLRKCLRGQSNGFTLLEMMTATTVLVMIMVIIFGITEQTSRVWKDSNAKIESFQAAKTAFDTMSRKLSLATLNLYFDYDDIGEFEKKYVRKSNLHFITGSAEDLLAGVGGGYRPGSAVFFQASFGYVEDPEYKNLDGLLNACGYYVEFGSETLAKPRFLKAKSNALPRYRFRLMEFFEPSERLSVISRFNPNLEESFNRWFVDPLKYDDERKSVRIISENIIALVIVPQLSPRDDPRGLALVQNNVPPYRYLYDTRRNPGVVFQVDTGTTRIKGDSYNRIPPCLQVVMVAIDEPSAARLESVYKDQVPNLGLDQLFKTADNLDADLQELENVLNAKENNISGNKTKLNYRIFKTLMVMRSAR